MNDDVLSHITEFMEEEYVVFASVSTSWKLAWGDKPKITRALEVGTTIKQLSVALEYGLGKTSYVVSICSRMGRIDLLELCQKYDFHSDCFFLVSYIAASQGDFELLKWCKMNNYPWDANICAICAFKGNLEMLKWARENGCPWDETSYENAIIGGNIELINWVLGCQLNIIA